jgi:exoribonuclease R
MTNKGIGYVSVEGFKQDIEINPLFVNTGLHGDRVKVRLFPHIDGRRPTGEIVEILHRERMKFVGVLKE